MVVSLRNPPLLTGTAVAADVAAGKTFYNTNANQKITGTASAGHYYQGSGATDHTEYNDKFYFEGSYGNMPYFKIPSISAYLWWYDLVAVWVISQVLGTEAVDGTSYESSNNQLVNTYTQVGGIADTLTIAFGA